MNKFGDLAKLTRGLAVRRKDGNIVNYFNIKDNSEIAGIMYDWTPSIASNPGQGVDGFYSRLTFAGQDKIGVVVRLGAGEDLQFVVQDDLTGLLSLEIVAEGHIVED